MRAIKGMLATAASLALSAAASANEPDIQSDAPLIHLADNLDEKDALGWCIDTQGRGFSDVLHAHSCKPAGRGDDTRFLYDSTTGQIRSVPFEGKCMTLSQPDDAVRPFGLLDCVTEDAAQRFSYDAASLEIRPVTRPQACVAVGGNSASAGPYMSRRLVYLPCAEVEAALKQWVVLD